MKSVLMSIKPQWCELIANGEKTVEVRKSRPKIETSFKVYIYCTKSMKHLYKWHIPHEGLGELYTIDHNKYSLVADDYLNGKVIGEFVCSRIDEIGFSPYNHGEYIPEDVFEKTCLSFDQMYDYTAEEFTYGWHISNLVIYDTPKELREFGLKRPPQSWHYVEEL